MWTYLLIFMVFIPVVVSSVAEMGFGGADGWRIVSLGVSELVPPACRGCLGYVTGTSLISLLLTQLRVANRCLSRLALLSGMAGCGCWPHHLHGEPDPLSTSSI